MELGHHSLLLCQDRVQWPFGGQNFHSEATLHGWALSISIAFQFMGSNNTPVEHGLCNAIVTYPSLPASRPFNHIPAEKFLVEDTMLDSLHTCVLAPSKKAILNHSLRHVFN